MPYAEDAKNFYILGMDKDLAKALANSIKERSSFWVNNTACPRAMPIRSAAPSSTLVLQRRWTSISQCTAQCQRLFREEIPLLENRA